MEANEQKTTNAYEEMEKHESDSKPNEEHKTQPNAATTNGKTRGASSTSTNMEEVLEQVGEFGQYQIVMSVILSLMVLALAFHPAIMYFVTLTPTWRCAPNSRVCTSNLTFQPHNMTRCGLARAEWTYTQPPEYSLVTQFELDCDRAWFINFLTSVFFVGWSIAGVPIGILADNHGRKPVLMVCLLVHLSAGLLAAFVKNLHLFAVTRFVLGASVPGVMNQAVMISAEFVTHRWRPYTLGALAIGFIIGLLMLALIAYFVNAWSTVYIFSSAPFLLLLLFYRFIPESFRWCRVKGKLDRARANLKTMAHWNGNSLRDDFEITPVSADKKATSVLSLFRSQRMAVRTVVLSMVWVTMGVIYYGIILTADDLGQGFYLDFVLINLATLPATFVGTFFLDYFGRKRTVVLSKFFGACLCASIALVPRVGGVRVWRTVLAVSGKVFFHMSTSGMYTLCLSSAESLNSTALSRSKHCIEK